MVEPNKRALWTGSAIDLSPDGRIQASAQILVPGAIGGKGTSKSVQYIVKTGIGTSVFDAIHNLQEQTSRQTFIGHRIAVFVGERMAKRGIQEYMDELERNPDSNLRANIFLVKGTDAKEFFKLTAELEGYTTKVATQAAQYSDINTNNLKVTRFVNTALSNGQRPFMQVVEFQPASETGESQREQSLVESGFNVHEIGLFNHNTQLVGYLNGDEADYAAWVAGALQKTVLTTYVEQGQGTVSLDLFRVGRSVRSEVRDGKITVRVTLTGRGIIRENNSKLNMLLPKDVEYVKQAFDQSTKRQTEQVIAKVQKDYGTDIFGFGENIYRHHPLVWRVLQNDWDNRFKQVRTVVDVNLKVQLIGNKGPSVAIPERNT